MRQQAFYLVFSSLFNDEMEQTDTLKEEITDFLNCELSEYAKEVFEGVIKHKSEIDDLIENNAVGWKAERLSKASLSILYVAIYEMLYVETTPSAVAINEAVEIAKVFGEDAAPRFINGILGTISQKQQKQET